MASGEHTTGRAGCFFAYVVHGAGAWVGGKGRNGEVFKLVEFDLICCLIQQPIFQAVSN